MNVTVQVINSDSSLSKPARTHVSGGPDALSLFCFLRMVTHCLLRALATHVLAPYSLYGEARGDTYNDYPCGRLGTGVTYFVWI